MSLRSPLVRFVLVVVLTLGCGTSGPSGHAFRDTGGRHCVLSTTGLACDVDAATLVTCTTGRPGYNLQPALHSGDEHADCAGCVAGTSFSPDLTTCQAIVCDGDADCPLDNYRCGAGICVLR